MPSVLDSLAYSCVYLSIAIFQEIHLKTWTYILRVKTCWCWVVLRLHGHCQIRAVNGLVSGTSLLLMDGLKGSHSVGSWMGASVVTSKVAVNRNLRSSS
jgi:hypothetical protein